MKVIKASLVNEEEIEKGKGRKRCSSVVSDMRHSRVHIQMSKWRFI